MAKLHRLDKQSIQMVKKEVKIYAKRKEKKNM